MKKEKKGKRLEDAKCSPNEKINCFSHNNDHWKTAPFWTDGPFCACVNSNTNTYSCVRNINATHNYLYCEFVSGIITYYNLKVDPYQLRNMYLTLSDSELNYMHQQLKVLKEQGTQNNSNNYSHRNHLGSRSLARQRSFIRRYGEILPCCNFSRFFSNSQNKNLAGQVLPPMEAYYHTSYRGLLF